MEKFIQGLIADIVMSSPKSLCSDNKSLVGGSDIRDGCTKNNRTDHNDDDGDLLQVPSSSSPPPPETVTIVSDNHKSHRWGFARSVSGICSDSSISSSSTPTESPESNMIGVSSSSIASQSPESTVVMDWRDARFMNNATKILLPSTSSSSSSLSSSSVSSSSASSNMNAFSRSPPRRSFDPRTHLPPQVPKRHYSPSVLSNPEPLRLTQNGRARWTSSSTMHCSLQAPTSTRTTSSLSSIHNRRISFRRSISDMDVSDHSKGESRWSAHSEPTHSLSWSSTSSSSSSSSSLRRKNVTFVDINGKRRMDRDCLLPSPRRLPEPKATICGDVSDENADILKPSTSSTSAGNLTVIVDKASSPKMKALPESVDESETQSGRTTKKQEEEGTEEPSSPSTTPTSLYDVLPERQRMPSLNHQRGGALFIQNDAPTLLSRAPATLVDGGTMDTGPDGASSFDSIHESLTTLIF